MRLGRPLAAASVMAAAIGASLAASPALADGSIKFADDQQNIVSPSDTAFDVAGTGCHTWKNPQLLSTEVDTSFTKNHGTSL